MGKIYKNPPVKLFISIFSKNPELFEEVEKMLSKKFGPLDFSSPVINFTHTQYYEQEFGAGLKRKFISFKNLIKSDILWKIKVLTNKLEDKFSKDNKRLVNLDPGYITQANLILASTKNFSHRIYIKNEIYEEITLIYHNKTFNALPWTYPDYQSPEYLDIFTKIRELLNSQLRSR